MKLNEILGNATETQESIKQSVDSGNQRIESLEKSMKMVIIRCDNSEEYKVLWCDVTSTLGYGVCCGVLVVFV